MFGYWFKCLSCNKHSLKTKKTYKIVAKGNGYSRELFMCAPCGDMLNSLYETSVGDSTE